MEPYLLIPGWFKISTIWKDRVCLDCNLFLLLSVGELNTLQSVTWSWDPQRKAEVKHSFINRSLVVPRILESLRGELWVILLIKEKMLDEVSCAMQIKSRSRCVLTRLFWFLVSKVKIDSTFYRYDISPLLHQMTRALLISVHGIFWEVTFIVFHFCLSRPSCDVLK